MTINPSLYYAKFRARSIGDISRPFNKPKSGRIAVKVINQSPRRPGDEGVQGLNNRALEHLS